MTCFDANVIIEMLLERPKAAACRQQIKQSDNELTISVLSLTFAMYYAEANKLELANVEHTLRAYQWLSITETDTQWAFDHYAGKDHEDALQIASAIRHGCTMFVTLDVGLAKKYRRDLAITLL